MQKNFDAWCKEKQTLEESGRAPRFHEREIWWCSIGINIGDEENGKNALFERPVLVIGKFNKEIALVLPMSTKSKVNPYYHAIEYDGVIFSVMLSQIRLVSAKRFRRFIRKISPQQLLSINTRFAEVCLGIKQTEPPGEGRLLDGPNGHLSLDDSKPIEPVKQAPESC
jgi:mRNA interferase MazF